MKLVIEVPEGYMVQVVPEEKSKRAVTEEWIKEIEPKFPGIDVKREYEKAKAWVSVHPRRQMTRAFMTNWLNRQDPAFYRDQARREIKERADAIIARGYKDSMGQWHEGVAGDAQILAHLREKYKAL